MTEILIGRQLLKAIGFDFEAHLETNEILNNSAFDTHLLNTVNTRLVKQLVLLTADSDPVPPTETAGAPIGTDSASEIQEVQDIYRIRLGSDPPAKILPLKVQLEPHVTPMKDTRRRYAPA
jgi:hypothetical protein